MEKKAATMRIDLIPEISDVPLTSAPKALRVVRTKTAAPRPSAPGSSASTASTVPTAPAAPLPGAAAAAAAPDSYAELFQNIYDAAIVTDLHGRVRDVNRRASTTFGYTPAQFSHLTVDRLVAGAESDLLRTLYENLRRETFTLMQASCLRADGTAFPAEVSVSQLRLSTPHLCFFVRDETVRRQTDEMLLTEHNALQNASDAIVVIDLGAKIEYANPATARIWGHDSAVDLVGQPIGALLLNAADGAAILESLSGENYESSGVAIAKRADGEPFRIEIHAASNRDSDGNVIGAVLSLSDLTERDRVLAAEHDAETMRAALAHLRDLHGAAEASLGDLSGFLAQLASAPGLPPELAAQAAAARDTVGGLLSIGADVAERLRIGAGAGEGGA